MRGLRSGTQRRTTSRRRKPSGKTKLTPPSERQEPVRRPLSSNATVHHRRARRRDGYRRRTPERTRSRRRKLARGRAARRRRARRPGGTGLHASPGHLPIAAGADRQLHTKAQRATSRRKSTPPPRADHTPTIETSRDIPKGRTTIWRPTRRGRRDASDRRKAAEQQEDPQVTPGDPASRGVPPSRKHQQTRAPKARPAQREAKPPLALWRF